MEPQEDANVTSTAERKEAGVQVAPEDEARPAVENGQTRSEMEQAKTANKRSDPSESPKDKSNSKAKKSSKRCRTKSKVVKNAIVADSSDTSSSEEDAESSSDSDSDSEVESGPRKKKASKLKKKAKATRNKKSRHSKKSQSAKSYSSDGSGSDSDESAESGEDDRNDADADEGNDQTQELSEQFRSLQLQISQLQQQLNSPNAFSSVGHALPGSIPGYGLNQGYFGGTAIGGIPGGPVGTAYLDPALSMGFNNGNTALIPPSVRPPKGRSGHQLVKKVRAKPVAETKEQSSSESSSQKKPKGEKGKKGSLLEFKRVDWVWDSTIYSFKLQDTAEASTDSQYNEYIFHVRRTFDCENKYRETFVDIKSKLLRECLQDVIGDVRGISLVDETPKLDPNLLFLYLDDFRAHRKQLKNTKPTGDSKRERRKNQKRRDTKCKHLKVLIKYIDKDYAKIKESLYPMLESGLITFDLLWALWKPNTLAYTSTYGTTEEPRAFKVELAERQTSLMKGEFYYIDGKYFEFDGKRFGYGNLSEEVSHFHGARKITSLGCYPLKYHKYEKKVRAELIERGKKFVSLGGMHFKSYAGIAYAKRRRNMVVKFNIQPSRIMVDPSIFRRINPNYFVSLVRSQDQDILSDEEYSDGDSDYGECDDSDDEVGYVTKVYKNLKGEVCMTRVPKRNFGQDLGTEKLSSIPTKEGTDGNDVNQASTDSTTDENGIETPPEFSDEEYLIASPIVLGFSFSEKQWLEFRVSGVNDIKWNDTAWDSLVLEPSTKDLIQALVKSRKYNATQTIDDVIQGKGKGLVTVLHGPPGTGKTLTAEGISELLKCPLYMVSAGELGTDSHILESELQKILDICHAWGAILLLDEADVFLEKRDMHEIHRNALVSIFLRQLEYFQGILFLTTNRVETFDEAFQSRIHIALRYDSLDAKAKKAIFKMFIERVRAHGKMKVQEFTDEDFNLLAKRELNGREIKNVVGSAQDLAVNKSEPLGMKHIRQVLDVHAKFGRDLRGGSGYEDAMRSYF